MRWRVAAGGIVVVVVAIAAALWLSRSSGVGDRPLVAITQIATHPALDQVRAGIISGLSQRGFIPGETIDTQFRNANGDSSLTVPITQDFLRQQAAVIVPISTPSALGVAKVTKETPVVFSGVTDPVAVGLVRSLDKPGGNITGVSDKWPFRAQVETFLKYFPHARKIGMIYTRGDDVSQIGVISMRRVSSELGFDLEITPVSAPQDIYPSAVELFRTVDAIFTGIDHLVLENMNGLVKASREAKRPLFGGESGSVQGGAVMALSINMTEFGELTAKLIAEVLNGRKPGTIPVAVVSTGELIVNKYAAQRFGLDLERLRNEGATFVGVADGD